MKHAPLRDELTKHLTLFPRCAVKSCSHCEKLSFRSELLSAEGFFVRLQELTQGIIPTNGNIIAGKPLM